MDVIKVPLTDFQASEFKRLSEQQMERERTSKMHDSETSDKIDTMAKMIISSNHLESPYRYLIDSDEKILTLEYAK